MKEALEQLKAQLKAKLAEAQGLVAGYQVAINALEGLESTPGAVPVVSAPAAQPTPTAQPIRQVRAPAPNFVPMGGSSHVAPSQQNLAVATTGQTTPYLAAKAQRIAQGKRR